MRCKGQALLSLEELGLANARTTRKHLKKEFGGASEDVKFREMNFENGMSEKGKKPFYRGIDIEAKLRQMKQEWAELAQMCPPENRDTYQYSKESELVKICLKHLRHTEYDQAIKELLNEIKFDRKLARAVGDGRIDDDEAKVEEWEYRNYKDGWVPNFEKLREKTRQYLQGSEVQQFIIKRGIVGKEFYSGAAYKSRVAKRPKNKNPAHAINGNSDAKQKMKCWACGLIGHKKGDTICKAEGGAVHDSAPTKAKRKFNAGNERTNESGPSVKKPDGICRFFSRNGNCKFGANCKFRHDGTGTPKKNKSHQRDSKFEPRQN